MVHPFQDTHGCNIYAYLEARGVVYDLPPIIVPEPMLDSGYSSGQRSPRVLGFSIHRSYAVDPKVKCG